MAGLKVGDYVQVHAPIEYKSANGTIWTTWSNTRDKYYILEGAIAKIIKIDRYGYHLDMLPDSNIGSNWLTKIDYKLLMFKKSMEEL